MASSRAVSEDTQTNRLIHFGMRLGVSAALHPFEYSKILIQVCMISVVEDLYTFEWP